MYDQPRRSNCQQYNLCIMNLKHTKSTLIWATLLYSTYQTSSNTKLKHTKSTLIWATLLYSTYQTSSNTKLKHTKNILIWAILLYSTYQTSSKTKLKHTKNTLIWATLLYSTYQTSSNTKLKHTKYTLIWATLLYSTYQTSSNTKLKHTQLKHTIKMHFKFKTRKLVHCLPTLQTTPMEGNAHKRNTTEKLASCMVKVSGSFMHGFCCCCWLVLVEGLASSGALFKFWIWKCVLITYLSFVCFSSTLHCWRFDK